MLTDFENFIRRIEDKIVFLVNDDAEIVACSQPTSQSRVGTAGARQSLHSLYPDLFVEIKSRFTGASISGATIQLGTNLFWVMSVDDRLTWIECTDITAHLKLEAEVARLKNLTRKTEELASLGDLVGQMSHELNTPLGICVTSASHSQEEIRRLEERYNAGILTKTHMNEYLESTKSTSELITSNLKKASGIVTGLRSMAANTRRYDKEKMRLNDQISEVIRQLGPLLDKNNINIDLSGVPNAILIYESPSAMSQVFSNLIVNSIRHGFNAASIDKRCITITASTDAGTLSIWYSDNGTGIPQVIQPKIFEPFVSGAKDGVSSGLGLSIVKEIVHEQLHGTVEAIPSDDGACFRITMEYIQ